MRAALKGTVLNMQPTVIKGIVHPTILFLSLLLTDMLSQTCINLFLVVNTKEDISKNVGNQIHLIVRYKKDSSSG